MITDTPHLLRGRWLPKLCTIFRSRLPFLLATGGVPVFACGLADKDQWIWPGGCGNGSDGCPESLATGQVRIDDFPVNITKDAGDVMVVIKRWLADDKPQQIMAVAPAHKVRKVYSDTMGLQPSGVAPRKVIPASTRNNLLTESRNLVNLGFISADCANYLAQYAEGRLTLPKRPTQYAFLNHRWQQRGELVRTSAVRYDGEEGMRGVLVVRSVDNELPSSDVEPDEGIDNMPVAIDTHLS